MSVTERAQLQQTANGMGLTVAGVRVHVSGYRRKLATVTVNDRRHPLNGWSTEYSWDAIERAVRGADELK